MDATPFVSVIIPTYHDWDRLKLCLNALEHQSYPANRFEVLVVNNDPEDQPPYAVANGNVRLIEEAKPGSYAARNAAIRFAKGDVFAFTDSDCIPDKDWLKHGIVVVQSGIDRVGGAVALFSDRVDTNNYPTAYQRCTAFRQDLNVANGWAVTANMIAKRYCFDLVGLFDGEMLSGGDIEWGQRANNHRCSIRFSKKSFVYHPIRTSWNELFTKKKRVMGGAIHLNKKKSGKILAIFYIKQAMPPLHTWVNIVKHNNHEPLFMIFKAMMVALIMKYFSLITMIKIIVKIEKEERK